VVQNTRFFSLNNRKGNGKGRSQ